MGWELDKEPVRTIDSLIVSCESDLYTGKSRSPEDPAKTSTLTHQATYDTVMSANRLAEPQKPGQNQVKNSAKLFFKLTPAQLCKGI